ncbi:PREDICTED: uncharacterized protein LOC109114150 [Nelumbo nucifera]|uniref:Uncharacterized protein LOC109114150 n=1 Tax=Nelumbo nucifera TaxID=4432 RepID=A0A1U8Q1P6_NELNU|nr:PREDICTED: uncharacterized protein LOC109114150 [Nelumbo nucifera]
MGFPIWGNDHSRSHSKECHSHSGYYLFLTKIPPSFPTLIAQRKKRPFFFGSCPSPSSNQSIQDTRRCRTALRRDPPPALIRELPLTSSSNQSIQGINEVRNGRQRERMVRNLTWEGGISGRVADDDQRNEGIQMSYIRKTKLIVS